jgi:hypothetical protein
MELRANPDAVAGLGVREIMDYLTDYITKPDTAPVIMGHSCGEPGWEAVADFALDWALHPVAGELD